MFTKKNPEVLPDNAEVILSDREKAFVEAYLKYWDASRAARESGYIQHGKFDNSPTSGYAYLHKPHIKEAIKRRLEELTMEANEVLARLSDQARGNMGSFIRVSKNGSPIIDWTKASEEGKLHLIRSFTKAPTGTRVELYDSQKALELLAKHYGLLIDRSDITSGGLPLNESVYDRVMEKVQKRMEDIDPESPAGDPEPD